LGSNAFLCFILHKNFVPVLFPIKDIVNFYDIFYAKLEIFPDKKRSKIKNVYFCIEFEFLFILKMFTREGKRIIF